MNKGCENVQTCFQCGTCASGVSFPTVVCANRIALERGLDVVRSQLSYSVVARRPLPSLLAIYVTVLAGSCIAGGED